MLLPCRLDRNLPEFEFEIYNVGNLAVKDENPYEMKIFTNPYKTATDFIVPRTRVLKVILH